jgi:GNAT superfamily N-acetyltransferase
MLTAEPTVRRATPDDAGAVMSLLRALAQEEGSADRVLVDEEGYAAFLGEDDVLVLLAELEGRPIGYVSAQVARRLWLGGPEVALDDLYVVPDARSGGVGRRLMDTLGAWAAERDMPVRWEVALDNDRGLRFYERLGATFRTKILARWTPPAPPGSGG